MGAGAGEKASPDGQSAPPPAHRAAPLTLGTAGHIDHGKTALVTALTGKNTDRLQEERDRGISIELGYAELGLPGGDRLSVVDVPGHERFVRTMVSGATGIDLFLLVIAADDGVMPQTREHIAIIELLGVRDGVVALTKADVVDDELLELAEADAREFLETTPYAELELVTVSARDGRGLDELLAALERCAARIQAGRRDGPARLPVDRVFPLKGIGTVVTGTLWRGELRAGDMVVVVPGGIRTAVRSVQVHDHEADVVHAGSRAGVNLRGVERGDVERGSWVVAPELAAHVGRRFDAWVQLVPGGRPLKAGDRVRLHHGTAQYLARVAPLEGREIPAGGQAAAVVRLDGDAAVEPHDRFILRALSPVATVGGGEVLVTGLRHWHDRARHAAFLEAVRAGDPQAAVVTAATDAGAAGVTALDLSSGGFTSREAGKAVAAAVRDGRLEPLPGAGDAPAGRWFAAGVLAGLRETLVTAAAERAAARPERPFSSTAELAAVAPALPPAHVDAILKELAASGRLVTGEGGFAPAGAGVLSGEQEALAARALGGLAASPFTPPTQATLAESLGRQSKELTQVLEVLARRGDVVRLDKDLWFSRPAVDEARAALEEMLAAAPVTLAAFRDRLDCGRRNAQALLEYFDREGLTLRRGDERIARRRRS
jgi:selenocysteine-specific elongation factor